MEKSHLPSFCQSVNSTKQTFIDSYTFHLVCTNAYGKYCRKIIFELINNYVSLGTLKKLKKKKKNEIPSIRRIQKMIMKDRGFLIEYRNVQCTKRLILTCHPCISLHKT